jgi:hypothetical protein
MKLFFCFVFSFVLLLKGGSQVIIEKTTDTTQYLIKGNWDNYLKWNLSRQSGSVAGKSNYDGIGNDGITLIYKFAPTGGWFDMNIALGDTLGRNYPVVFHIRSSSEVNDNLEIKFTDKDGSVFRRVVPLNRYSDQWNHITVYLGG